MIPIKTLIDNWLDKNMPEEIKREIAQEAKCKEKDIDTCITQLKNIKEKTNGR